MVNLRPEQIQYLYNTKLESGTGVRTIEVIHTVIHKSLNHLVKLGVLNRNPSDAVSKPRTINHEMRIFTEDEVNRFLNLSQGTRNEILYHISIATGLRQSVLLAIKWSDIDWEKRTHNVQCQLKRKHKLGGFYNSPKTIHQWKSIDYSRAENNPETS